MRDRQYGKSESERERDRSQVGSSYKSQCLVPDDNGIKIDNANWSHLNGRELVSFFNLIMGSTARKNASIACSGCRKRKVRCDGCRPSCGPCTSKNALCDFSSSLDGRAQ
jgi:hypothetical protein